MAELGPLAILQNRDLFEHVDAVGVDIAAAHRDRATLDFLRHDVLLSLLWMFLIDRPTYSCGMRAGDSHLLRITTTTPIDRAIGGRVRAERWRRHWSCERLARAAQMSPMQLRFVEWGWARLSARDMLSVLLALDRRPAWLFEDLFPGED